MKTILFSLLALLVVLPSLVWAHDFEDEGLSDTDLAADLAAEVLPTTDSFRFGWENFLFRIQRVFTFKADRKAELDRAHLHRLDRKLTACGEIGDEECIDRVQTRIDQFEDIAQKHLDTYEELQENFSDHFIEWREHRHGRVEELRAKAQDRVEDKEELIEEFKEHHQDAIERRREHREHIIELRSQRLKDALDKARHEIDHHHDDVDDLFDEFDEEEGETNETQSFYIKKDGSETDIAINQHTSGSGKVNSSTAVNVTVNGEEVVNYRN